MRRLGIGTTLLAGAAAGAAAFYFLDANAARRRLQVAAGQAKGKVSSVMPHADIGDVGLARKVESEIFRPADAPKGQVAVNAENGVVFLRGAVDREWIERLGHDAEQVGGVKAVRNLLHAPGTPAPIT